MEGQFPTGGLYHAEGPTADGGWWTFNVWESTEAQQRFADEVLHPVLTDVGTLQALVQRYIANVDESGIRTLAENLPR